jgi:hypothetical protein
MTVREAIARLAKWVGVHPGDIREEVGDAAPLAAETGQVVEFEGWAISHDGNRWSVWAGCPAALRAACRMPREGGA